MKFSLMNTEINEAVNKMGRLLSARTTLPILAGVLVEAKKDCITFTVSDGTESLVYRALLTNTDGNEVFREGKSVFSKETFDITKKLKGNITFELTDEIVKVSQKNTRLEFPTMFPDEYPAIKGHSSMDPITISGKEFADLVKSTTFATSTLDTRPILQAVNMTFSNDESVIVATDSHRLSRVIIDAKQEKKVEQELSLSVPASVLDHALRTFDFSQDVIIVPKNQSITLLNGNTILHSRLLEGKYPDTERLIPTNFKIDLILNTKELLDGLELLHALGDKNAVTLSIAGLFVKLAAVGGSGKKGVKELAYDSFIGDEGFSINFSAQYVIDALKRTNETNIRFRFNDAIKPFIIVSPNDETKNIQLVLPMRQA